MVTLFINGKEVDHIYWEAALTQTDFLDDVVMEYGGEKLTVRGHPRPTTEEFSYTREDGREVKQTGDVYSRADVIKLILHFRDVFEGRI